LARSLTELGVIAYNRSEFDEALALYEQALDLTRAIGDRSIEAHLLDNMGEVHRRWGDYDTALDLHHQALALVEFVTAPFIHARILNNIGVIQYFYGNYAESLRWNIQALAIAQRNENSFIEGRILSSIGLAYTRLGNYDQAEEFFQQALPLTENVGHQAGQGRVLNNIGNLAMRQGYYGEAINYFEQAIVIHDRIDNRVDGAMSIGNLGLAYWSLGEYTTAFKHYQDALAIHQDIDNRPGEAKALASIGGVSLGTGNYADALDFFQRSLHIFQEIGAATQTSDTFNSIGATYYSLSQFDQALDYYNRSALIRQEINDRAGLGTALNNIGLAYNAQGKVTEALVAFQDALAIRQALGDRAGEASTLNNIGALHNQLQDYGEAIAASAQALAIYQAIGNPVGVATALTNLGSSYRSAGQFDNALDAFRSALTTFQTVGNREGERFIFSSIGDIFAHQGEPEVAIIFYKQAVNVTEAIRQELRPLPSDVQQSYTATVSQTYRRLADLLLQSDRVLEAQRVLDLLKVQELDDYLRGVERSLETESGIPLRPEEQQFVDRFQSNQTQLVALGQELEQLEQMERVQRSPQQRDRIRELRQLQQASRRAFRTFFESAEIQSLVAQLRQTTGAANLELTELNALQDNLRSLNQNAVLFYPLVLEDRVELILITPNAPPIRRTSVVDRVALNRAIADFRSALQSPHRTSTQQVIRLAQPLYDWLIRPIEQDLAQATANTILYAPDGQLRYIPLAALHDGRQWLIERHQINNITAASLADLDNQPFQGHLSILAAAFTQGQHQVEISNNRTLSFGGLSFAGKEVEVLAQLIPDTDTRLDDEFNPDMIYEMNDFSVVHLATHATFNPGPPEDSFILFGDGSRATLTDIRDWTIPDVELVVLSACETAVGDVGLGTGEEILGFGYLMQLAGADAAIASLWQVSDGGTQALMDAFYMALQNGYSKTESLQRAQRSLITGNTNLLTQDSRNIVIELSESEFELAEAGGNTRSILPSALSHPYYWAPFILIGNGL
ncbi:MAG: tetratricopeptide repeat protein, partial [Merismopedia sp. SIO2A8]|nr:tetratricopeptide repeat protein [Merismopedia sp. SIO2A8]